MSMTIRLVCAAGALLLVLAQPASAKTISMGTLSRNSVESACEQAGGTGFGFDDDTAEYGCYAATASVICNKDSDCHAAVSELVPMTSNSLSRVLGLVGGSGARMVGPVNAAINPVATPDHQGYEPIAP
jgi:hypothetical protein